MTLSLRHIIYPYQSHEPIDENLLMKSVYIYISIIPSYVSIIPSYVSIVSSHVSIIPSHVSIVPSYISITLPVYIRVTSIEF